MLAEASAQNNRAPILPLAVNKPTERVPVNVLGEVADRQARAVWGEDIARGEPFEVADASYDVAMYAFPYAIGTREFPDGSALLESARDMRRQVAEDSADWSRMRIASYAKGHPPPGRFGSVYVSAHRGDWPIIRITHSIHPYYLTSELAQAEAARHIPPASLRLDTIYLFDPHEEYYEFASGEQRILVNVDSLECITPAEALGKHRGRGTDAVTQRNIAEAWEQMIDRTPRIAPSGESDVLWIPTLIPMWRVIPIVNWTWWCVPTSQTMILCFYDNYVRDQPVFAEFGRLVSHWYEHHKSGHNVPDFIDVIIDPSTGNWRAGYNGIDEFMAQVYGYGCDYEYVAADSSNDWGWDRLVQVIEAGRPVQWGTVDHAAVAFGVSRGRSGKFVQVYTTWGDTSDQQWEAWIYTKCTDIQCFWPHAGPAPYEGQMLLDSPYGGEVLICGEPFEVKWYISGSWITRTHLDYSVDAGRTWTTFASNLPSQEGWNTYTWHPTERSPRTRIRITGQTAEGHYAAGDGSHTNLEVR